MGNVTAVVNPVTTTMQVIHRTVCLSSLVHLRAICTFPEVPIGDWRTLGDLPNAEEQRPAIWQIHCTFSFFLTFFNLNVM